MLSSTIRPVHRINLFKYHQFIRLQSAPTLAHLPPYFSDSGSEDHNSNSRNEVLATNHGSSSSSSGNKDYSGLNSYGVIQILQNMKTEPVSALSFFNQLKEKGFQHDAGCYLAMIKVLCHSGMDRELHSLFTEVINLKNENLCFEVSDLVEAMAEELKAYGPSSLRRAFGALIKSYATLEMFDEAIHTLFAIIGHGIEACLFSCNFLMIKLAKHGKMDATVTIYKQLKNLGLNPNVNTFEIAVKAYVRMGSLEEAEEVFMEMEKAGVEPNVFTYTAYLEGLCRHGQSGLAYEVLRAWKIPADTRAYNTLIWGFVSEKKLKEAEMLLLDMEERGLVPNKGSYHALIKGYCDCRDVNKAVDIHDQMKAKGIKTNCFILTPILQCWCLKGMHSIAVEQFIEYKNLGMFLDNAIYNVAIDALCKMGKLDEAKRMFDNEVKLKTLTPDAVHYTTLINGYCLHGNISYALHLFEEMKQNGLRPDVVTYNVLVGGLSRNGRLDKVYSLLDTMKRQGLTPSTVTHNMIIEGLCFGGRVREAEKYFSNLEEKSIEDCYSSMVNGYCKSGNATEGFKLFCRLFCQGILIRGSSCEELISSLCLEGQNNGAIKVLEIMLKTCDGPSKKMYIKLITALCDAGDMEKAQWAYNQMVRRGFTPNAATYTIMLKNYFQANLLQEASALFTDMKDRGISPNIITYTVLLDGLCKVTLKEARTQTYLGGNRAVKQMASTFLHGMKKMGVKPDVIFYTALIDSHCKSDNLLQDADTFFNELIEQGLLPDTITYTALIFGYCKQGNMDKAFTLAKEMKSKGIELDSRATMTLSHFYHIFLRRNNVGSWHHERTENAVSSLSFRQIPLGKTC